MAVLETKDLGITFGGLRAVDDVYLKIEEQEIVGLIGPNGAGKTTIFKLIMGIYPPTTGKVIFDGRDITKMPTYRRVREGISIKMQIPGVYLDLTLYDNIRIAVQKYVDYKQIPAEIDPADRTGRYPGDRKPPGAQHAARPAAVA